MVGHELTVEEAVAAEPQARDQMNQRDLRGVARAAEHRFAKERPPKRHAEQAPDDRPPLITALDRMRMTERVEPGVGVAQLRVDPRFFATV